MLQLTFGGLSFVAHLVTYKYHATVLILADNYRRYKMSNNIKFVMLKKII